MVVAFIKNFYTASLAFVLAMTVLSCATAPQAKPQESISPSASPVENKDSGQPEIGLPSQVTPNTVFPPFCLPIPVLPAALLKSTASPSLSPQSPPRTPISTPRRTPVPAVTGVPPTGSARPAATRQPFPSYSPDAATASPVAYKTIHVLQGKPFTVTVNGKNWIYTGAAPTDADIRYMGKVQQDVLTVFSFIALKAGSWIIHFQQQNLETGSLVIDQFQVVSSLLPESSPRPTMPSQTSPQPTFSMVETQSSPTPSPQPLPDIEDEEPFLKAVSLLPQEQALDQLERFLNMRTGSQHRDYAIYLSGRFHEQTGPRQDILKALTAYRQVVNRYRLSQWYNLSLERIRHIERNYLDIR